MDMFYMPITYNDSLSLKNEFAEAKVIQRETDTNEQNVTVKQVKEY